MILTANYLARAYGVKSGLPGFIAKDLCPNLVFVQPNLSKYRLESLKIGELLKKFDPNLGMPSSDEFVLDVTEFLEKLGQENDIGRMYTGSRIRSQILKKTGLKASCGIACNRLLAKVCADLNKPDALTYLKSNEINRFMDDLPVGKLSGIGKVNEMILLGLGISTCGGLLENATSIYATFSEASFDFLVKSALGIGKVVHDRVD